MPIFDQGYQHWDGTLSGHAWRWLAITREGVRAQWKKKGTRYWVMAAFTPALLLVGFISLWGLLEQGSPLLEPFMFIFNSFPEEVRKTPQVFRGMIWTFAYDYFFRLETFISMVIVAIVGPNLISQDLRFNAMPLYLSRPLRRIDYFVGKLGVIATYIGAVAVVPAVVAYLLGLAFSFDFSVLRDTWRLFLGALGYGLVVMLSAGTLMLAMSSITRSSRFVAALWVGMWLVSSLAGDVLQHTAKRDWCPLVSYVSNLYRVRESLLGTPAARDQLMDLVERSRRAALEKAQQLSRGPFAGLFRPSRRERREFEAYQEVRIETPRILQLEADKYPWTWSAAVLAGLFAASVFVLSTRVKSLDRLK